MSAQLVLLEPKTPATLVWAGQGRGCKSCRQGHMNAVLLSDPCACTEAICMCLAEGYARCDGCGAIEQIWPREMQVARPRLVGDVLRLDQRAGDR